MWDPGVADKCAVGVVDDLSVGCGIDVLGSVDGLQRFFSESCVASGRSKER